MEHQPITTTASQRGQKPLLTLTRMTLAAVLIAPALALAQVGNTEAIDTACGFLNNVQNLLNAVSIVVVTIAIIFSGYQIAFAHKRITDVAPVMIGAILIGAASQIAKMFLSGSAGAGCGGTVVGSLDPESLNRIAAAAQWLFQYA